MRTAGKFLIFTAVFLRAGVVLSDTPEFQAVVILLTAYGLILVAETWMMHRVASPFLQSSKLQFTYLFLQSILIIGVLVVSSYEDFIAQLFIPLSLDAVTFFGRRIGFRMITVFSLAMISVFLLSSEGPLFGLAMGVLYSGLCFLFGGYAAQVEKAEAARLKNQRTYEELQTAHRQLQGYADHVVQLAVERERNHLARDLHDSVTQTVFSMNLAAESAILLWEKEPVRVTGQLSRLEELAAGAQREIQSLVSQLSPPSIAEMGLPAAFQRLADEQWSKNGLHISLEILGDEYYPGAIAAGLFSITQEALTNTAKHSGVCEAAIRLHMEKGKSCLEIEDHGRGFDPQALLAKRGHLGLTGMSERAREMGWSLSIASGPGQGTTVRVTETAQGGST